MGTREHWGQGTLCLLNQSPFESRVIEFKYTQVEVANADIVWTLLISIFPWVQERTPHPHPPPPWNSTSVHPTGWKTRLGLCSFQQLVINAVPISGGRWWARMPAWWMLPLGGSFPLRPRSRRHPVAWCDCALTGYYVIVSPSNWGYYGAGQTDGTVGLLDRSIFRNTGLTYLEGLSLAGSCGVREVSW